MISCEDQDYVEIACLFKFSVELKLKDGQTVQGVAEDTKTEKGVEIIVLAGIAEVGGTSKVPLDRIESMRALDSNPHFNIVYFNE